LGVGRGARSACGWAAAKTKQLVFYDMEAEAQLEAQEAGRESHGDESNVQAAHLLVVILVVRPTCCMPTCTQNMELGIMPPVPKKYVGNRNRHHTRRAFKFKYVGIVLDGWA